jgi:plastocyanin
MRIFGLAVGAAVVLAACGGGDKTPAADSTAAAPATQAPATDSAATTGTAQNGAGATHDVNMVLEGTAYKFVPATITAKAGDKIVFHNVSGGPHNVQFWADSIPTGTAEALDGGMGGDKLGPLNGPLLTDPNSTYEVSLAPTLVGGEYKFTCTPHMAMGMNGKIVIQ